MPTLVAVARVVSKALKAKRATNLILILVPLGTRKVTRARSRRKSRMEEHLDLAGLAPPPSGDPSSISMVVFTLSKAGTGQGCVCVNHSSSAAEIYGGSSFDGRPAVSEDRGFCSQL